MTLRTTTCYLPRGMCLLSFLPTSHEPLKPMIAVVVVVRVVIRTLVGLGMRVGLSVVIPMLSMVLVMILVTAIAIVPAAMVIVPTSLPYKTVIAFVAIVAMTNQTQTMTTKMTGVRTRI